MLYSKITIEKIFNRDTGKEESATSIFSKFRDNDDYVKLRRILRIRNKQKNFLYLCDECGTELEISCMPDGEGDHTYYFKHIRDPKFTICSLKTDSNYSQEEILKRQYAFKSESNAHIMLKQKVGEIIRRFVYPDVIIDKKFINDRFGDKEKRKPDIYFKLNQHEITIEFQVNNTFHSIIQEREAFYERNKISLIWVFGEFNPDSFQSITIKDIYIPNGNNAFVFDNDAEQASYTQQTLCLKVFYKKYSIKNDLVIYNWENEIIPIMKIKFNSVTFRPFHFDCAANREQVEHELETLLINREIEFKRSNANSKANKIKNFLTDFKNNDHIFTDTQLETIIAMSDYEADILNDTIGLNKTFNGGKNVIQVLLEEANHRNLVMFLLKAINVKIPFQSVSDANETTFVSIFRLTTSPTYAIQLLFSRGYKLSEIDNNYIIEHFQHKEQNEHFYTLKAYEMLESYPKIEYFYSNIKKYLVIESAKQGRLTILGNENQKLNWMANLAADKYQKYWYYFDKAFSYYGFYEELFSADKNGTFKKNMALLSTMIHSKDQEFEDVLYILYPELI